MFSKPEDRDAAFSNGRRSGVPSIISPDLKITGDLISDGDIQLNGTLVGDIKTGSLTIGESAHVEGKVLAREIRISGQVTGEVTAEDVTLTKSARINGDIIHENLAIESGADVEGHLRRQQAPRLKAVPTASSEESKAGANGSGKSPNGAGPGTASV
jgi:cytoskeletal protein CcmA (bactofilin family)